jgi:hypothetical protein
MNSITNYILENPSKNSPPQRYFQRGVAWTARKTIHGLSLKLKLLKELVGRTFTSTEYLKSYVLDRIEEIVDDRVYPAGFQQTENTEIAVFEAEAKSITFKTYFIVEGGRIRIIWINIET